MFAEATAQSLDSYRWKSRLVLVFTPTPGNQLFQEQVQDLKAAQDALEERDLLLFFMTPAGAPNQPKDFLPEATAAKYYKQFGVSPQAFELILIGLDGTEKYRSGPRVTAVEDLMRRIDAMPMRRRELREKKGG